MPQGKSRCRGWAGSLPPEGPRALGMSRASTPRRGQPPAGGASARHVCAPCVLRPLQTQPRVHPRRIRSGVVSDWSCSPQCEPDGAFL
eukprot:1110003-Prorocentrum_minimum.AAC.2